jgi:hypothetical protein
LRSNFPDVSLPDGFQAECRDEVFRAILRCLPGELFIDDGRLKSVRLQCLLNASALPEGPPPEGSLAGILAAIPTAPHPWTTEMPGGSRFSNDDF